MLCLIPGIFFPVQSVPGGVEVLAGPLKMVIVDKYLMHHKLLLLLQSHIAGDWCMRRFASKNEIYIIYLKKILACVRMPCIILVDSSAQGAVKSQDAYFLSRNPTISGQQPFSAKSFPLLSIIRGKKDVILGRDQKTSSPGSPCTTLSKSTRFVQAFGQTFSVIFQCT